jgi:hypothetical protein
VAEMKINNIDIFQSERLTRLGNREQFIRLGNGEQFIAVDDATPSPYLFDKGGRNICMPVWFFPRDIIFGINNVRIKLDLYNHQMMIKKVWLR